MANTDEIKAIELRRLAELEKQRAYYGVDCPPKVLIEIADLRDKYGKEAVAVSRIEGPGPLDDKRSMRDLWNEVDFLRAICAAALREFAKDKQDRKPHQRLMIAWMALITVVLLYAVLK